MFDNLVGERVDGGRKGIETHLSIIENPRPGEIADAGEALRATSNPIATR